MLKKIEEYLLKNIDVVVVGAGASGLMAAGFAAKRNLSVVVLEKNKIVGKKLLITGKGRCNVINDCDVETFLSNVIRGDKFLRSSVSAFCPRDIMKFFNDKGVSLVTERGNRVFPNSNRSADIVNCLKEFAIKSGATIATADVKRIDQNDDGLFCVLTGDKTVYTCKAVVVATGGKSYPLTGSTGDGYRFAKQHGHTVTKPIPALVSLESSDKELYCLSGLSLKNVTLNAVYNKKQFFSEQGEMLFTHDGISGPLSLSLSSRLRDKDFENLDVFVDLKPALAADTLDQRIWRDFKENINKEFKNSLSMLVPKSLIPIIITRSGIDPSKKVNSITADQRKKLVLVLKRFEIKITDLAGFEQAIITSGGVELKEINPKTMQSKKVDNLYFVGEVLDCDAYTGGFNLGIAFSTAAAAGNHILRE